jgi:glycosyltransferase involved in cell wall biosynthesis
MHIAFWSPGWPLEKYQNGIVTYVHWMKRELEARGHRVSVFTSELDPSAAAPGIHLVRHRLSDRLQRRLRRLSRPQSAGHETFAFAAVIAAAILSVHRRTPIQVIEMEESFGWFADVARRTRLPMLVKLHGPAFLTLVDEEVSDFGREKIEREGRALRCAAVLTAPSVATLERTIERYHLAPAIRAHLANPLIMDADTPLWRLEACSGNTILFVGRFDLLKGGDVILKAFRAMLQVRPDLRLVFVGPDLGLPTRDGEHVRFAEYCQGLFGSLRDRVDYRGRLPNREIARLRPSAMVTVVASRWENQSYALLETMFQGCPLVSTDAGGCPESVVHGVTGRLAKSGDPDDFAAQILELIADPLAAQTLGAAARRYVLERHSPAQIADASLTLYARSIELADRDPK